MTTDEYMTTEEQVRWTCEECGATGTMTYSDMLDWFSPATIHQSSHADGPFGAMPKLIISEDTP